MSRREYDPGEVFQAVLQPWDDGPSLEARLELLQAVREQSQEARTGIDGRWIREIQRLRAGLEAAQSCNEEAREQIERLTAPPWCPALLLEVADTPRGRAALVLHGNTRRVVGFDSGLDDEPLMRGDEVLLAHELNVIIGRSPYPPQHSGEVASFDRHTEDGRLLLRWRDEPVIVDAVPALAAAALRHGELVRWNREGLLALERIEQSQGEGLFLEDTPQESFDDVGGLDREIETIKEGIALRLQHADVVRAYGLRPGRSVLFVGGPGTGKTMLARGLANWLGRISTSGRAHFMNIKPGALHSMWYSQSEANYREVFRIAREAGEREPTVPVVLFFDEVDAIGAVRGEGLTRVDDRVLTAFMAELDGLENRGNILVVGATNRVDALDPALVRPGRLGDLVLEIGRPRRAAAHAIFAKHLGAAPCESDLALSEPAARHDLIEACVARVFAPNGELDLATLTMRDGRRRSIKAVDLVSGAHIANIVDRAKRRAVVREVETGRRGLRLEDLSRATEEVFAAAARTLSPANCHKHLPELPADAEVVRVEYAARRATEAGRYRVAA